MKNKKGFTLVEVLIAVALLALIGVFTGGAVFSTFKVKTATENDIQALDVGRAVLRTIVNDIRLAFHRVKLGKTDVPKSPWGEDNTERMPSSFIGRDSDPYDELHFTSLSHRRFYMDSHEGKFSEVSYYVTSDDTSDEDNMTLYKREDKNIDDNITEGGKTYKVAEFVSYLDFKYWDCQSEKYVDSWDSVESVDYKGRFPEAVKISLGLDDMEGGVKEFETVVIIAMPNNIRRRDDLRGKKQATLKPTCGNKKCDRDKDENHDNCPQDCPKEEEKVEPLLLEEPLKSCSQ